MTSTANITSADAKSSLWLPALAAAGGAAVATTAVAAVARQAGASLEVGGEAIPLSGFFTLTLMFSVVGIILAAAFRRWVGNPRLMFVRTTVALTALSFVPDLLADVEPSTRITLMATHLVAAMIVIPVVAKQLGNRPA